VITLPAMHPLIPANPASETVAKTTMASQRRALRRKPNPSSNAPASARQAIGRWRKGSGTPRSVPKPGGGIWPNGTKRMSPVNVVSPAGTGIVGAPTVPQYWGILATVTGPEYAQPMVTVPAPGIPVTVNWLEP